MKTFSPEVKADFFSRRTIDYKRRLWRLDPEIRRDAKHGFRWYFRKNPFHPALDGAMVRDLVIDRLAYRVRVGHGYRAMSLVEGRAGATWFIWYWIGTHDEYERRLA